MQVIKRLYSTGLLHDWHHCTKLHIKRQGYIQRTDREVKISQSDVGGLAKTHGWEGGCQKSRN